MHFSLWSVLDICFAISLPLRPWYSNSKSEVKSNALDGRLNQTYWYGCILIFSITKRDIVKKLNIKKNFLENIYKETVPNIKKSGIKNIICLNSS